MFFADAGIHLNSLRFMAREAREILRHPHPFATDTVFKTDGKKVYADIIERSGDVRLYDLYQKAWVMRPIVEQTLKEEIVYSARGEASAWYPRPDTAPHVLVHPKRAFGRPTLSDSGVPIHALVEALDAGENVVTVSRWFEVPEQQVQEANDFYRDLARAA